MDKLIELLESEANTHHDGAVSRVFSELAKVLKKLEDKPEETEQGEN